MRASTSDRLERALLFPAAGGDVPVIIRGSKDATRLSAFFRDRQNLLHGKLRGGEFEAKWRGVRISDRELYADASGIYRMANAAALRMENLYASVGGVE